MVVKSNSMVRNIKKRHVIRIYVRAPILIGEETVEHLACNVGNNLYFILHSYFSPKKEK